MIPFLPLLQLRPQPDIERWPLWMQVVWLCFSVAYLIFLAVLTFKTWRLGRSLRSGR